MYRLAVLNSHPVQYFAPLYRRLAEDPNLDVTVYFCSHQGLEEYVDEGFGETFKWDVPLLEGYKHKFLSNLRSHDKVNGFFSLINPAIIRELRNGHYDALWVHGHNYVTYELGIFAAKLLGIPVLMRSETHLGLKRSSARRALRKPLMGLLYNRLCAACLPIGTRNRQFYSYHGVPGDRLFDVPYAVDNRLFVASVDRFRKDLPGVKAEAGVDSSKPLILFAGKFLNRKRAIDLLKAFDDLRRKGLDAGLLFVGSGEQENTLREYARENEVPDVYFLGFRNQSELPKFFAIADLFVLPAEDEPWGLIINEAMCAGLPIVAAAEIGAVADLLKSGENGFTYPVGNIEELSLCLQRLVSDSDLRREMGQRSREIIDNWSIESAVEGIHQALAHVSTRAAIHESV